MGDWPVGLSTGCFYQTPIFDCLEQVLHAGFNMVEVCSFPAHLDYHDTDAVKRANVLIHELGLEAYSFHAPFSNSIDITALDGQEREHAQREIIRAAEAAALLEVRRFVIHPGPESAFRPPPEEHLTRIRNAAGVLNSVARRCNQLGIGFSLENMLPHLLFGHTSDILWMMGALEVVSVGTCLDTGHAFLSGDIHNVMYKLSGHLQMIHASDNRGTHDDHLPPGKGSIDWPWLLGELSKTRFHGAFILELSGDRNRETVLDEARQARRFLRMIMRELDLSKPPTVETVVQPARPASEDC